MDHTLVVLFVLCCAFAAVFCLPTAENLISGDTYDVVPEESFIQIEEDGFITRIFNWLRSVFAAANTGFVYTWNAVLAFLTGADNYE
ncbi:hypothetical protein KQX54_014873 [Cotesia glomerata]|uniref:Uncharacterized protein n=1 Tax=Cotesia glomerata TaxID=32391 RepID=A0AAV7IGV7_COTGL|nr:hypothetical protein KQX54_014873 [Cotesia glomerata]